MKQRQRRTGLYALALFSTEKTINLRGARCVCLLLFQADSERALLGRDRNLVFARQPPNCPVERGFVPFYRYLQLAEGLFAPRVERIPNGSGSLADFFFDCDSLPFAQSSPREYTPLDQLKRVRLAPVSQIHDHGKSGIFCFSQFC